MFGELCNFFENVDIELLAKIHIEFGYIEMMLSTREILCTLLSLLKNAMEVIEAYSAAEQERKNGGKKTR